MAARPDVPALITDRSERLDVERTGGAVMAKVTIEDYQMLVTEVVRVVRAVPAEQLDRVCEACPEWTIRQLVGHMVHTLDSERTGGLPLQAIREAVVSVDEQARVAGARARDEWTHHGATTYGSRPINELLSDWQQIAATEPEVALLLVPDVAVHLHDIAETLELEAGGRPQVLLGLGPYSSAHKAALQARGLPAVQLRCADGDERFGDLRSGLAVSGNAYDLCRVLMGRRTQSQADALIDWGSAPAEVRHNFPLYGLESWHHEP